MATGRTRSGRGQLLRDAEKGFMDIKEELINPQVVDLAVNFRGVLSTISAKYTNDAIVDIIPEITSVLNRFDALLTVNSDLTQNISELSKENSLLMKHLQQEKCTRRDILEDSLHCEEKSDKEIKYLKSHVKDLENSLFKLKEELNNKNEVITLLRSDCENVTKQMLKNNGVEQNDVFLTPKNPIKENNIRVPIQPTHVQNKFAVLSTHSSPPSEMITVQELDEKPSTQTISTKKPSTQVNDAGIARETKNIKRKIVVLADSQGKEFEPHLKGLEKEFQIFVYSSPGAKLKNVVKNGESFVKDLTDKDFVIILAGSNDAHRNEPTQLTIAQGLKSLFSIKNNTNILVNSIPYRHDDTSLNNRIFFTNHIISKMIGEYKGGLNISYGDINSVLRRSHFTKHGLHYSRLGKAFLGRHFTDLVFRQRAARLCNTSTTPELSSTGEEVDRSSDVDCDVVTPAVPEKHSPPPTDTSFIELFNDSSPDDSSCSPIANFPNLPPPFSPPGHALSSFNSPRPSIPQNSVQRVQSNQDTIDLLEGSMLSSTSRTSHSSTRLSYSLANASIDLRDPTMFPPLPSPSRAHPTSTPINNSFSNSKPINSFLNHVQIAHQVT